MLAFFLPGKTASGMRSLGRNEKEKKKPMKKKLNDDDWL